MARSARSRLSQGTRHTGMTSASARSKRGELLLREVRSRSRVRVGVWVGVRVRVRVREQLLREDMTTEPEP